ncbi:MAG: MFS transporter [Synergistales bacterium]|nr:MFS transporter [Bacteroidales bacterium]MDY6395053.1 MFS transporter [Bacteroidales bacterium]MDY6435640.1 MFS transporter [Synergistales bacterium]
MKTQISKKVTFTILSISLLTVMAGAAMAPALGTIREHFSSSSDILIQFVVSLPALFIIITNLWFSYICRFFKTKTIAVVGLLLYVTSGSVAFFADNMVLLLILRSLLGISVGLIMPLSTGLLSFYFPPKEQAKLMGLAGAMSQMGGVIATMLAGLLANIAWNYAFLVYLLGLIALILVLAYLPNDRITASGNISIKSLSKFHPSVTGMLFVMVIFFIFPTNFAIISSQTTNLSSDEITIIMVGLDLVAVFMGLLFGKIMNVMPKIMKYFAPLLFMFGYICYAYGVSSAYLIVGSLLIGMANGIAIPYLNTIASIKGGKDAATTVMPLISASLYLGQFISPIIVNPLSKALFNQNDISSPYKIGIMICILFLIQTFLTRNYQSLPPRNNK